MKLLHNSHAEISSFLRSLKDEKKIEISNNKQNRYRVFQINIHKHFYHSHDMIHCSQKIRSQFFLSHLWRFAVIVM